MKKLILFLLVLSYPLLTNAMNEEEKDNSINYSMIKRIREIFPYASKKHISDEELNSIYNGTSKKDIFELHLNSFLAKKEMKLKRKSK